MNTKTFPRYMMGTTAIHQLGDISRTEEDYCYIKEQTSEGYVGQWVTGYGFINVLFSFDTTRELTPEEEEYVETHDTIII